MKGTSSIKFFKKYSFNLSRSLRDSWLSFLFCPEILNKKRFVSLNCLKKDLDMKKLIFLSILSFTVACERNVEPVTPAIYSVPAEVQPFIETFKKEAALRNVTINLDNLIISFEGKIKKSECGVCEQVENDSKYQKTITLNKDSFCWNDAPSQNKEALVFHELGHCILGRLDHRNDLLPNKAPASIMTSTLSGQYEPCQYAIGGTNDCNKTSRRKYYIDELFNPKTPVPDWAK
jgi:hypothetical protein